jgi:hypothetical protein
VAQDVQEITGSKALVAARLCNFATGKAKPLAAHNQWMESKVKPVLASNPSAWVDILGHASRQWNHTGGHSSHQLNATLSMSRCEQVKGKIATLGPKATFNLEIAKGDAESVGPKQDDGYDRAVEVYVYAAKPKPAQPGPPKAAVQATTFEIRVVGGGSASIGAQADDYFFQVVDLTRSQTAFFFYTGVGAGFSIPKIPGPGSFTKTGDPASFTTTADTRLHMFNSQASLFQDAGATLGSLSVGGTMRLAIEDVCDGTNMIFTHPKIIPISGGPGIQMPGLGSASHGVFTMVSDVMPFTGY